MADMNKFYRDIKTANRAKMYRLLGYILVVVFGLIGWVYFLFQAAAFSSTHPEYHFGSKSLLSLSLITLAYNIFLWAGVILLWRADRNESPRQPSRWLTIIKFYGVFAVLVLPLAIMFFISKPLNPPKYAPVVSKWIEYKLPENFTKTDVINIVQKMRGNSYYQFYFQFLDPHMNEIVDQVYASLENNRSKYLLYKKIQNDQQKVQAMALLFSSIIVPPKYSENPEKYPQITKVIAEFLQEEFKVTVLGTVYRSNYDKNFTFHWDAISRLSAWKLKQAIGIKK